MGQVQRQQHLSQLVAARRELIGDFTGGGELGLFQLVQQPRAQHAARHLMPIDAHPDFGLALGFHPHRRARIIAERSAAEGSLVCCQGPGEGQ
jgi:hypothetical protein